MRAIVDIGKDYKGSVIEHLSNLSDASKRMRFFSNITLAGVESYVDRINWEKDVCFGIFDENKIIAFVHLAFIDNDQMELGISVSEENQKEGLGRALMQRVMTWCKAHNINKLIMECLSENKQMQSLSKGLGMRIVNDRETAIAQAAITTTFSERIAEIQKNMIYENIAIIDKSVRSFYNDCCSWSSK
jgi:RimJ/RimL family protein N-acetyltransferase